MDKVEFDVCPKCGSDDTTHDDDLVYDYGYSVRICEQCKCTYRVYWESTASRKEIVK